MLDLLTAGMGAIAVGLFVMTGAFYLKNTASVEPLRPEATESNIYTLTRPFLRFLMPLSQLFIWPKYRKWASRKLDAAGLQYMISVDDFFSLRFLLCGMLWAFTPLFTGEIRYLFMAGSLVFPELWLREMINKRHDEIRRTMPYIVDLLSLCTGAGLEFGTAIDRVIEKSENGPLTDELKQVRRDVTLGLPQHKALEEMAHRVQLPELTSFVAIVVQAMKLGSSVSDILDAQAEKMRIERYEKSERLGARAQQKILVPLMLFILPAFVILSVVPLVIEILQPMFGGNMFGGM